MPVDKIFFARELPPKTNADFVAEYEQGEATPKVNNSLLYINLPMAIEFH